MIISLLERTHEVIDGLRADLYLNTKVTDSRFAQILSNIEIILKELKEKA